MSRRQALNATQIIALRAAYVPGVVGYETLAKMTGIPASTIRDCLQYRTAYSARIG